MKVTVQFGRTGIVVPCGDGAITVQQLIHQAVQRYCKNTAKEAGYSMKIHHLEYMDGGILDPDDVLIDVVEDKDKLVAVYEEQEMHRAGEVANGSLADRQSPDTFESELAAQLAEFQPITGEIEVTSTALKGSTPLMVRRSSDPALIPPALFQPGASQSDEPLNRNLTVKPIIVGANWAPADDVRTDHSGLMDDHSKYAHSSDLTKKVEFSGDGGPLGIHVVPFNSTLSGRFLGLSIRGIEENSRTKRERLLQENECIVKINENDLMDRTFVQAQEVFRTAMQLPAVLLQIVPGYNRDRYERSAIGTLSIHSHEDDSKTRFLPPLRSKPTSKPMDLIYPGSAENSSSFISTQISSPKQLRSNSHSVLPKKTSSPTSFGTKKQGKKIKIDFKKGSEGLGFTVVTRESSVHGPGPILVKNILQRGAAVKDGRLQTGDRILEVNGIDIMGKAQEELVAMLRSTKQGEIVALVVARHDDVFVPRELKGEQVFNLPGDDKKEYLTFEIPLNDSGSAGLGISLKGNKSKDTGADLGIFIKAILHGGAAFKDGQLRVNDQLIAVNGEHLLEKSNHEALETLRRSMSMEGNVRGMIQVMVARRMEKYQEDHLEVGVVQNHNARSSNGTSQWHIQSPGFQERVTIANDDRDIEIPPPVPPHPEEEEATGVYKMWSFHEDKSSDLSSASELLQQRPMAGAAERQASNTVKQQSPGKIRSSKSMDLVADESNFGSLAIHQQDITGSDVGPMLGLKKSSSLESLQTAVAEVRKNELPFHRPRPHMVRGRGCNESFRAAIDKSYDGPEIPDDDSEESSQSGHETQGSESALQGAAELEDVENSDSKGKKEKKKKEKKKKVKTKGKDKDKEKKKESDNQEKKAKKKGFGAMLRFGKKKEEKGKEQKSKQKSDGLNEEELERMKEERDRIDAKHQELRERQAKERYDQLPSTGPSVPDIEDDDMDPNYAKVNHFREPPPSIGGFKAPSPQLHKTNLPRDLTAEQENLDELYAKVNKQQPPVPDSARPNNIERIHQLRKEYHQARREGAIPSYEEHEGRRWPSDYEPPWIQAPVKGPNGRSQFEDLEHQFTTLPRHPPGEPDEHHLRSNYNDRDLPRYLGAQHPSAGYSHRGNYPRNASDNRPDPRIPDYLNSARLREAAYNLPSQYKGPHRHDVPPSPKQTIKTSRHHDHGKMVYRESSPNRYRYAYQDGQHQDPRQKNGMTAAV
ncbi:partitioning defective 3 homolog B-like [Scyliorhinus canicula]|uniref:partitioning defective 3 homolog B-like n=1 Tax=Scyliorhinus canicula TaxID=7830 RepID=UPI0018F60F25|nr:partitioning defective 3 homolog B-like [Scyliorhinus canicula]